MKTILILFHSQQKRLQSADEDKEIAEELGESISDAFHNAREQLVEQQKHQQRTDDDDDDDEMAQFEKMIAAKKRERASEQNVQNTDTNDSKKPKIDVSVPVVAKKQEVKQPTVGLSLLGDYGSDSDD